jgi:hypothetical protein
MHALRSDPQFFFIHTTVIKTNIGVELWRGKETYFGLFVLYYKQLLHLNVEFKTYSIRP